MVLNVFFGPLSISYDAWMMSHIKLKKVFLRLKIDPKVTFSPKSLLTFSVAKLKALKTAFWDLILRKHNILLTWS